jgi:hypothetical protein
VFDKSDGLFPQTHYFGNMFVGKMAIEQQFCDLQIAEVQRTFEAINQFGQSVSKCESLQLVFFVGSDIPTRSLARASYIRKRIRQLVIASSFVGILNQADMPCLSATVGVDDLASKQYKEICFQTTFTSIVLQTLYEGNECLLNGIFGIGGLMESGLGKTQQSTSIAVNKF